MATSRNRRRTVSTVTQRVVVVVAIVAASLVSAQTVARAQPITCQGEIATIVGTRGNDRLSGTPGKDVIAGLGGDDVIFGRASGDLICGGWGNDLIFAGNGADRVFAGYGYDTVHGGKNGDVLFGGPGRDTIIGNTGFDTIDGGPGADSLMGGRGDDALMGGAGPDRIVGGEGTDSLVGGPGRDICAISDENRGCESPTAATRDLVPNPEPRPEPGPEIEVDRVIFFSIDGLRSDFVVPFNTPTLWSLRRDGVSTMNARTDPDRTTTLPNHTSQLTGRPINGPDGHRIEVNDDPGGTVHDAVGSYVSSVFDVAHDHGVMTAMYAGKEKFELHHRTWGDNGARDTTGEDNGRDKLDVFFRSDPQTALETFLKDLDRTELGRKDAYIFFHIRLPDSAGHGSGWGSEEYADAVNEADQIVARIVSHIDANPEWASSTAFIVTADHGGPTGEKRHHIPSEPDSYRIPFIVSAPGVRAGGELYSMNRGVREDPGGAQPDTIGIQPIRGHEVGNLGLDLLGLPPIPGSVFNARHDLRLN